LRSFCVYGFIDPRNDEIFYIGMGWKSRPGTHLNEARFWAGRGGCPDHGVSNRVKLSRMIDIIKSGAEPRVLIFLETTSRDEAALAEADLIHLHAATLTNWHRMPAKSLRHGRRVAKPRREE